MGTHQEREGSRVTRVAVYGSLRRGFGNHGLLEDSLFIGEALTEARYTMLHLGGFPGVVKKGNTSITVELYDVDEETLRRLDRLEGHPGFYERLPVKVLPVNADQTDAPQAWEWVSMYLLPNDWDGAAIETGDWARRTLPAALRA